MSKTTKSQKLRGIISTVDVFDNSELSVIARFPYSVVDELDRRCAYVRARMFVRMYSANCNYPLSQFALINQSDKSVISFLQ